MVRCSRCRSLRRSCDRACHRPGSSSQSRRRMGSCIYSGSKKKIGCELTAWMSLRSTFFLIAHWAANRRHGAVRPLAYEQYDLSERYGGITVARSTKHKLKQTIGALVDPAAGSGTARTIKGKAKELAGLGAARLA